MMVCGVDGEPGVEEGHRTKEVWWISDLGKSQLASKVVVRWVGVGDLRWSCGENREARSRPS